MTILLEEHRHHVAKTALVVNTSGNVSVRVDDHVVITPSGCAYEDLTAEDILVLDLGGPVPVAPYQAFGTPEPATSVTEAIRGRSGKKAIC